MCAIGPRVHLLILSNGSRIKFIIRIQDTILPNSGTAQHTSILYRCTVFHWPSTAFLEDRRITCRDISLTGHFYGQFWFRCPVRMQPERCRREPTGRLSKWRWIEQQLQRDGQMHEPTGHLSKWWRTEQQLLLGGRGGRRREPTERLSKWRQTKQWTQLGSVKPMRFGKSHLRSTHHNAPTAAGMFGGRWQWRVQLKSSHGYQWQPHQGAEHHHHLSQLCCGASKKMWLNGHSTEKIGLTKRPGTTGYSGGSDDQDHHQPTQQCSSLQQLSSADATRKVQARANRTPEQVAMFGGRWQWRVQLKSSHGYQWQPHQGAEHHHHLSQLCCGASKKMWLNGHSTEKIGLTKRPGTTGYSGGSDDQDHHQPTQQCSSLQQVRDHLGNTGAYGFPEDFPLHEAGPSSLPRQCRCETDGIDDEQESILSDEEAEVDATRPQDADGQHEEWMLPSWPPQPGMEPRPDPTALGVWLVLYCMHVERSGENCTVHTNEAGDDIIMMCNDCIHALEWLHCTYPYHYTYPY
ncbi:hypothetical protein VOLCADRAFT_101212 [Volvox carteri f. nagariensis]|uniref:Uncharacterized protein n=1 Tax=Volvox carteri f. nagariensis TaxID=3068 RepID=D8UM13_VOLCA|nr:uncharacterized protein VOLCADRAFT_101212 [Volvox carteri f. nagariensis]EFJ39237.1 hypothetical protein VOLCADRAFT_101212 [Volvox carteri f. nagariensis]|eukprot:XP_002959699.1 hypothetical protein VOLCADRAFT_101212 [Volvox carteri f. nagariensis]